MATSFISSGIFTIIGAAFMFIAVSIEKLCPPLTLVSFISGSVFLFLSSIQWLICLYKFFVQIDRLSRIDDLYKKMFDLEKRVYASNQILNDINRHVCDGMNGLADILQERNG